MDVYSLLAFGHILLFVFWLGTDIGVFLAAKMSERRGLSVETRAAVLGLGMVLDRLPRSALVLIVPSGLQLAAWSGWLSLPPLLPVIVWLIAALWLAILWTGFLNPETTIEARAMRFNFVMNVAAAVAVGAFAIWSFSDAATPRWLDLKLAAVAAIFVIGVLLDIRFKPAVAAFLDIVANGPSEERDARYSTAIGPVYRLVVAIYGMVVVAAFLGTAKPAI